MIVFPQDALRQQPRLLRKTVSEGEEAGISFHARVYGVLVPFDKLQRERDELAKLRARVEELEAQLCTQQ